MKKTMRVKTALYDKKGNFIREFKSIFALAKYLGVNRALVSLSIQRGYKILRKYYAKAYDETYKEKIKVTDYRLRKELRCYRLVRGKLKFDRKFRNLVEGAKFFKMNYRTFIRRVKEDKLVERRGKTYRFRFVDKENLTNHVPNHNTHKRLKGLGVAAQKVPIKLIDKDGNELKFDSIAHAVKELNMNRVAILHVLAGRQKRTFGYKVERVLDN